MAYGKKYIIRFKNRIQNDFYRTEIWEKDFAGDTTDLEGSDKPFTAAYTEGDTNILAPIQPVELTISFWNNGLTIEDFYSDDDEQFRIDHYFESDSEGGGTEKLLYSGYLIEDGVTEPVTDRAHVITLKATDNLALLKNIKWNEVEGIEYNDKLSLLFFVQWCLKATGLYSADSAIDMSLPLRTYNNIFENSNDDRSDDATNDTFSGTVLDGKLFQDTDNTWQDLYTVLTKILGDLNCCLFQADGCWNILRKPEYQYFTDGAIPGTEWVYLTPAAAVTLTPLVNIARTGGDCFPLQEDQNKSIQRPLRYVKDTFDYNQPASFIIQSDLQLPAGATPFDTNTVGDLRYDDYDFSTYFPDWVQRGTVTSYLEIVTDTVKDVETDRYIVIVGDDSLTGGIQFNPIEVTAFDKFDFTLQWRTDVDTDDLVRFWVRFILIGTDGNYYHLTDVAGPGTDRFQWSGPFSSDFWDEDLGIYHELTNPDNIDTSQWMAWKLSESDFSTDPIPLIPADGILLIEVRGTDAGSETGRQTTYFKDITLDFTQYVNQSTQITGQTHTDTDNELIKAVFEDNLNIDDSPRNTIAGTLFTNELTNFDYTDTVTGQQTLIGDIDFTRTRLWHRAENNEALRLGNIITQERLMMKHTARSIIEGTLENLRYTDKFISPLSLFRFAWLTGKSFNAASITLDYMACTYSARLVEIFKDADIIDTSVYVTGLKNEELGVSTGAVTFDVITNYGGADSYITPSISNSKFTYINSFDTTVDLSVILYVPISGTGTATVSIVKNGTTTLASDTVNATAHFKRFDFLLTEAVTNTDYFEVMIDNGGADVDIQTGSINITVNNAQSMTNFPYQFNYKYKTD